MKTRLEIMIDVVLILLAVLYILTYGIKEQRKLNEKYYEPRVRQTVEKILKEKGL